MVTSIDIGGVPADRIRVAPSPLAELAAVLHLLAEPQHHPHVASAAASMAAAIGAPLAAELDELGLLWPPAGADVLLPPAPRRLT